MKNARQTEILALIRSHAVSSQDELQALLSKSGFPVTQATISRDIRELQLIKKADSDGIYRYILPDSPAPHAELFAGNILSVDFAGNTVVIKCRSGTAQAVCTVLDNMHRPEVVGTLAGDDTIFVLLRNNELARRFAAELRQRIQDR